MAQHVGLEFALFIPSFLLDNMGRFLCNTLSTFLCND